MRGEWKFPYWDSLNVTSCSIDVEDTNTGAVADNHETNVLRDSVRRSHAVSNYRPSSSDELRDFLHAD
jgi:hypothetical protein